MSNTLEKLTQNVTKLFDLVSPLLTHTDDEVDEDNGDRPDDPISVDPSADDDIEPETAQTSTHSSRISYIKKVSGTEDDYGPSIDPDLSTSVSNILEKGLIEQNHKEISLKYKTPQNCEALNVIKVKDEILKNVRKETRKKRHCSLAYRNGYV